MEIRAFAVGDDVRDLCCAESCPFEFLGQIDGQRMRDCPVMLDAKIRRRSRKCASGKEENQGGDQVEQVAV